MKIVWEAWEKYTRRFKLVCCDCALCHWLEVRIKDGDLEIRFSRDYRGTAARRRKK